MQRILYLIKRLPRFLHFCLYTYPRIWYGYKKREGKSNYHLIADGFRVEAVSTEIRQKKIMVLYLARGANSTEMKSIEEFFSSYQQYSSGISHELVLIIKGFKNECDLSKARSYWSGVRHTEFDCSDDAFDLGAFVSAAKNFDCDGIMFLNTFSRIEGSDWLLKIVRTFYSNEGIGMVGCSASLGKHRLNSNFKMEGPNPHIRTNGFFIERILFLRIVGSLDFKTKESTLEFESGDQSITKRLVEMGYRVLLVGRNGVAYKEEEWAHSGTFALGHQGNLLVSDNQTSKFLASNPIQRVRFTYGAWGYTKAFNKQQGTCQR